MRVILLLTVFITNIYAAVPTVEGLFRNPANPNIEGDYVVLQLSVEEIKDKANTSSFLQVPFVSSENSDPQALEKGFYKFIINKKPEASYYHIIQVSYETGAMNIDHIKNVKIFKHFQKSLLKQEDLNKKIFYSLLTMFSLNSSAGMSDLLSKYGVNYAKNKEVMNKDKVGLMKKYKSYLSKIKENVEDNNTEEIDSPFKPKDEEASLKVKDILSQNMYNESTSISLTRKSKKFYWQVELENIYALFSNNAHQLLYFKLKDKEELFDIYFRDYILFNGRHNLPKNIDFKISNNKTYKIKILKYSNFLNKSKNINERYKEYNEAFSNKNEKSTIKTEDQNLKPSLII